MTASSARAGPIRDPADGTNTAMDPLAYIVILNWNGKEFLRDCLRSVLAQTYENRRILVVDNASTDGSRDLAAQEFPEVGLLPLPENLHFARGTNAGIEAAMRDPSCEFVATLNNDTRVDPEWLSDLVRAASPPGIGSVASKMMFMDRPRIVNSAGLLVSRDGAGMDRGWNERDEGQFDSGGDVFGASAGAALYRRRMLDEVGILDPDFLAYYEDVDLAWRARLAGWTAVLAPHAVVYHKFSASMTPRSAAKQFLCERNRIWNLVQNYPWGHVVLGGLWSAGRLGLALAMRTRGTERGRESAQLPFEVSWRNLARARLEAYAGLPKALRKRTARQASRRVHVRTVARWLRDYGVPMKDLVAAPRADVNYI